MQAHQAAYSKSITTPTIFSQDVDLPEPVVLRSMEVDMLPEQTGPLNSASDAGEKSVNINPSMSKREGHHVDGRSYPSSAAQVVLQINPLGLHVPF